MSSFQLDMRKLFRLPRSVSLTVQLALTLVGLVVFTTTVLMFVAFESSRTHLETEARAAARRIAQQREGAIARVIEQRHEHAQVFLRGVEALCGERTAGGTFSFELECLGRGLQVFAASERARGVRFERGGRRVVQVGEPPSMDLVLPAPFARLIARGDTVDYGIRAERGRSALVIQFSFDD